MKRKQSIALTLAMAAIVGCAAGFILRKAVREHNRLESKLLQEQIETFENEGGLVLS